MFDCNECGKWKEKETYFDNDGRIKRQSFSTDKVGSPAMKVPIKIDVIVKNTSLDELPEIVRKVDVIRNEQPLTEARFIIEC